MWLTLASLRRCTAGTTTARDPPPSCQSSGSLWRAWPTTYTPARVMWYCFLITCLSACLYFVSLSARLSVCLSICPPTCLCPCLPVWVSISTVCLSGCLCLSLSARLDCLSVSTACLSVCLAVSVRLPARLSETDTWTISIVQEVSPPAQ